MIKFIENKIKSNKDWQHNIKIIFIIFGLITLFVFPLARQISNLHGSGMSYEDTFSALTIGNVYSFQNTLGTLLLIIAEWLICKYTIELIKIIKDDDYVNLSNKNLLSGSKIGRVFDKLFTIDNNFQFFISVTSLVAVS
jgi:hypothetical protein